jgi:hypothetical protein
MTDRIFTSHWRSPLLADADCVPVSISRGEPRWRLPFAFRRMRALAPDDRTWAEQDPAAFRASYERQLWDLGAGRIVEDLERVSDGCPVVCLCWERPTDDYCHRWTLAAFVEREAGIVVPELTVGDLPRRPDSPQVSLFESYRGDRK